MTNYTVQKTILQIESISADVLFSRIDKLEAQIKELSESLKMSDRRPLPNDDIGKKLLTVEDMLKLFHISRPTLSRWEKSKILKSVRYGNRLYFPADEVDKVLNYRRREL